MKVRQTHSPDPSGPLTLFIKPIQLTYPSSLLNPAPTSEADVVETRRGTFLMTRYFTLTHEIDGY